MYLSKCCNERAVFVGDEYCDECPNKGDWECSKCGEKCVAWDSIDPPERLKNG